MNHKITANAVQRRDKSDFIIKVGMAVAMGFFIISGSVLYSNMRVMNASALKVTETHNVLMGLSNILSSLKDAETGQRGYIITGEDEYLKPYNLGLENVKSSLQSLEKQLAAFPEQQQKILPLKNHIKGKLDEMDQTISIRKTQGFTAAQSIVVSDRGKAEMDQIRTIVENIRNAQQMVRKQRLQERGQAYVLSVTSGLAICVLGIILSIIVSQLVQRASRIRMRQEWLQTGLVGLNNAMSGEQNIHELGNNILNFMTNYCNAHAGVFFARQGDVYARIAAYGIPENGKAPEQFTHEDRLLGQAAKNNKIIIIDDVPDDYISVGSGLGEGKPRSLIIAPTSTDDLVNGVVELGFTHAMDEQVKNLLEAVAEPIAIAFKSARYREHLQNLLEETQTQSEELQAQGEELRVSNEELEEQSRVLQESQSRLEQQQAELEQTNAQLEEQAQALELQRDDLAQAQESLKIRTQELEQASQYKSDFLANMSHELRTPLNSSLILAKLLADNPDGNLSEEQVRHAETIEAAGNDLLNLINDILDLSKIEAGHMEIIPEPVLISRFAANITRFFEPLTKYKGLSFKIETDADVPKEIFTDGKRFEQILKNLLSNAIKFTEKGGVTLEIKRYTDMRVAFVVTDTGIGISDEQKNIIFDAFKQADGTTNRKYGGTGLGLSISRELSRLLGGEIQVESVAGKGSVFTVIIPEIYEGTTLKDQVAKDKAVSFSAPKISYMAAEQEKSHPVPRSHSIDDDRDRLNHKQHTLLIVEDDESFARILLDLAHEQKFQCLIATTADEAIKVAAEYLPHAVILDVGLPDHSGLSVLDRLKQHSKTRHIPVHIISAHDYTDTAYSLGAIGYMGKPVKREDLVKTLKEFEVRLTQRMRTILIVEDDKVQRESMEKLLTSQDVRTVSVGTAAECLEKLKNQTFDCMVLDLSLPDASGYSLLETLSQEDDYAFPPVIVYTGKDLSSDQEQQLRRYSKSIIIKGAKSPERLLDEVTLFLHQVVSEMPPEKQKLLKKAKNRDAILEGRRILIVEDDIRNIYSLSNILEPRGAIVQIARNGKEAIKALEKSRDNKSDHIDLILMDVMMPEMDGITATRKIRVEKDWKKLPIIMLTAKAMRDDQERCIAAGANDYMAKPLDVEKLLSLVRVWMPR